MGLIFRRSMLTLNQRVQGSKSLCAHQIINEFQAVIEIAPNVPRLLPEFF